MPNLNEKSHIILSLLAEGLSTGDILADHPQFTAEDITHAARAALNLHDYFQTTRSYKSGDTNPRTYEVWTREEDQQLQQMLAAQVPMSDIAKQLERHPMVIRRRIRQLEMSNYL